MTLGKLRQFARLMNENDGEGSDLGGSSRAIEDAIDAIGTQPDAEPEQEPAASEASAEPEADEPIASDEPEAKPGSRMAAMLDELTDDPNQAKPEAKPAAEPEAKPADAAAVPPTLEQEEAELLAGVKSERGKERIKQVFAERKALEQDITEFRELVKSSGMNAQEFAQSLEFGRLVSSGDEKNLRVALEMIEGQRAVLYQKLGVEAPGVDLLAGQEDLKDAVDNMEMTRERAIELSKFRKADAAARTQQQAQVAQAQDRQAYEQTVTQAAASMEAYLSTRANEVDHQARMKIIGEHFKNPANLQQFVSTYQPQQWATTVKMMYDNIQVPRQQTQNTQPIRSRPATLGTPSTQGSSPIDRIAQRMESMGL